MSKLYKIDLEKTHTSYKLADGSEAIGTTTLLSKVHRYSYGLVIWGWQQGKAGLDIKKTKDKAADIGTIAHAFIMCHFAGWVLDTSNLIPGNVEIAENAFLSFLEWFGSRDIKVISVEEEMVSQSLGYGGTTDLIGEEDGELCLYDFKSGKGIYDDHYWQVCGGYRPLAIENGYDIKRVKLIHIPKDDNLDFGEKVKADPIKLGIYQRMFELDLEWYRNERKLKGK
jgi:hypothetical protein